MAPSTLSFWQWSLEHQYILSPVTRIKEYLNSGFSSDNVYRPHLWEHFNNSRYTGSMIWHQSSERRNFSTSYKDVTMIFRTIIYFDTNHYNKWTFKKWSLKRRSILAPNTRIKEHFDNYLWRFSNFWHQSLEWSREQFTTT